VSDAKRLRLLEEVNAGAGGYDTRQSCPVPVDGRGLKDLPSNNGDARREAGRGRASLDDAGNERPIGVSCTINRKKI